MHTMYRLVALAALCLLSTAANAQNKTDNATPAQEQQHKWFSVPETEQRYNITVKLKDGESLVIRFRRISDWTGPQPFLEIFSPLDKAMLANKDSLKQEQNTRTLEVYIPASRKNIISRFRQTNESGSLMAINDDGSAALKLGIDTLRAIEAQGTGVKIQYTFLLKDIRHYNDYAKDEVWKDKIARTIDAEVKTFTAKWKHPDAARHGLDITYDPATDKKTTATTWRMENNQLMLEGSMGISLVRNTLCPSVDLGLGMYLNRNQNGSTFVRASLSGFLRYDETSPSRIKAYGTSFVNAEIGGESNRNDLKSLFYRTSVGFGYKLLRKKEEDRDPTMDKQMYRVFFNYSINRYLTITPEVVSNFRKNERNNSWFGLSLSLRILD